MIQDGSLHGLQVFRIGSPQDEVGRTDQIDVVQWSQGVQPVFQGFRCGCLQGDDITHTAAVFKKSTHGIGGVA